MSKSNRAAEMLGLPPGVNFHPDDDELVEFFLLPSARGEPAWFPGVVVIEDDNAPNTVPWKLLKHHGLADDDEAYFLVRSNDGKLKECARQVRYCGGGWKWVSQRPSLHCACIGGEEIKWRKHNLSLQMGRGKSAGSTGWVMHEYALTQPPCPFLKICHVVFSGHGQKRKRIPDDDSQYCQAGEPASHRARIDASAAAAANNGGSATSGYGSRSKMTMFDQDYSVGVHASAHQQEPSPPFLNDAVGIWAMADQAQQPEGNDLPSLAAPYTECEEQVLAAYHQDSQLLTDQGYFRQDPLTNSNGLLGFPSQTSGGFENFFGAPAMGDKDDAVTHLRSSAELNQEFEEQVPTTIGQQLPAVQEIDTAEQQFWDSIGVDISGNWSGMLPVYITT